MRYQGCIVLYKGEECEPSAVSHMITNPLYPDPFMSSNKPDDYLVHKKENRIEPLGHPPERNAAADLIRQKLEKIYAGEPDARKEIAEAEVIKPRSKHQQFMHELANSGRNQAEVQTAWHQYYASLPDDEKRQVWDEFYANSAKIPTCQAPQPVAAAPVMPTPQPGWPQPIQQNQPIVRTLEQPAELMEPAARPAKPKRDKRSKKAIKKSIVDTVTANGKLETKHHLHSLIFGLSMGALVIFIFLFGFFNELIIAPFIQPSRHASATPLILSNDGVAPTPNPEVIIPKINVELPVDFTQTSTNEATIENALENGVVHYPTTAMPGQNGNTAFFGHSSNNIFNKGKYKFAFVLLHELVPGDTFYITNNSKVYVYKVISKTIVDPTEVGVLGPVPGQTATATLITCDPPGTSVHRLIVVGQQISPDPGGNTASTATATTASSTAAAKNLPGNGPTLFSRLWHSIF